MGRAVLTGAAKSSFHWMTTVIGVTCLYSIIYLPAYLHLCESAEALVHTLPATGYPELRSLLLTFN